MFQTVSPQFVIYPPIDMLFNSKKFLNCFRPTISFQFDFFTTAALPTLFIYFIVFSTFILTKTK